MCSLAGRDAAHAAGRSAWRWRRACPISQRACPYGICRTENAWVAWSSSAEGISQTPLDHGQVGLGQQRLAATAGVHLGESMGRSTHREALGISRSARKARAQLPADATHPIAGIAPVTLPAVESLQAACVVRRIEARAPRDVGITIPTAPSAQR